MPNEQLDQREREADRERAESRGWGVEVGVWGRVMIRFSTVVDASV